MGNVGVVKKLERATTRMLAITVASRATSPTSATPTRRTKVKTTEMLGKERETKEKDVERPTRAEERLTKETVRVSSSEEKEMVEKPVGTVERPVIVQQTAGLLVRYKISSTSSTVSNSSSSKCLRHHLSRPNPQPPTNQYAAVEFPWLALQVCLPGTGELSCSLLQMCQHLI